MSVAQQQQQSLPWAHLKRTFDQLSLCEAAVVGGPEDMDAVQEPPAKQVCTPATAPQGVPLDAARASFAPKLVFGAAPPQEAPADAEQRRREERMRRVAVQHEEPQEDLGAQPPTASQQTMMQMRAGKLRKLNDGAGKKLERRYSVDEVKYIVNRALEEHAKKLRTAYDAILQQRLQEQFQHFSTFREDYVSKHMKASDFSYVS
eukprot:TRINITY_DN19045_c0_g1_i1.p1 TRINITY_DN19045_c0_g1~~TRINITY_DN19045_c0_g1_i1.p1  ORF type:complete len:204 (-),score=85.96 TRINITY_DN19045_c0_g1_i1:170-781(-)